MDLTEDGVGYSGGDGLNIFKRTDGLENWSRLFLNDNFSDLFFVSEQKGFVISYSGLSAPSGLYETTDGGINWERVPGAPDGTELLFLDTLTGFIGSNLIYKTTDRGVNWYVPNGGQGGAGKIFFINDTIGWAIRSNVIYKTTDRGENWFTQFIGTDNFTSIFFIDTLNGWATSDYIWLTTDGGNNWIQRTDIPAFLGTDVYFSCLDTGWTINNYSWPELYKTTDNGLNWYIVPEVEGARKFYTFPDPIHWIINGFSNRFITTNSGNNWLEITGDVPSGFNSFQAPTNNLGYAVGNLGLILRYDDTIYVPVELLSFSANAENQNVYLRWKTATEINNKGYEVQRLDYKGKVPVNQWKIIGFIEGNGTSASGYLYTFVDKNVTSGKYSYRLKQIDFNANYHYSNEIKVNVNVLIKFNLEQNYPNPFNLETNISFTIPEETNINLKIFDITGSEIKVLVNEKKQPGYYTIKLKGGELNSGVYFYRLTTSSGFTAIKKLILLK